MRPFIHSDLAQVSCYFEAVSGQATVADNIMYNMPRAAVNFNDDAIGGSLMTRNLIWNTCRESQDQQVPPPASTSQLRCPSPSAHNSNRALHILTP